MMKSIRSGCIVPDDFKAHPVWTWMESDPMGDEDMLRPVFPDENIDELSVVFVLAYCVLANGAIVLGNCAIDVGTENVYCIEVWVGDTAYAFNRRLPEYFDTTLAQLRGRLNVGADPIFPIAYRLAMPILGISVGEFA